MTDNPERTIFLAGYGPYTVAEPGTPGAFYLTIDGEELRLVPAAVNKA